MSQKLFHDEKNQKFIIESDGFSSELRYHKEGQQMDMYSTFVPPEGRGQGLAQLLAEAALDYAQDNKLQVIPSCSYIAKYIERNSQYQSLLTAKS